VLERVTLKVIMNLKKGLFLFSFCLLIFLTAKKCVVFSGEFTNASATLNNARLSFKGALQGTQVTGSSLVIIDTTNYPSKSVLQLQNRDTVLINDTNYTVATTIDNANDDTFNLTTGLDASDVSDDLGVYATQSATLTVRLTTISALNNGSFRILVPAASNTAASHDGYPDAGGFEFGKAPSTTAAITCPVTASYGTFSAASTDAQTANINIGGVNYHSFVCDYTGLGAVGTIFDGIGTNEEAFVITNLINPAPKFGTPAHALGQADTYSVIIQHLDSAGTVVDQTTTKVGVVDAVKVSAYIAPQLTFTIGGLPAGTSACGVTTDVPTTELTVPFGDLAIGFFVNAAQRLTVTTNAVNGYAVTVAENDQVARDAHPCSGDGVGDVQCLVDASVTGASHLVAADWTSASTYPGFGYSLHPVTAGIAPAFTYNEAARTFSAKQFADLAATEMAQLIFSRATVTQSDIVNVCYRIAPAATNAAGNYENYLVYTASATF